LKLAVIKLYFLAAAMLVKKFMETIKSQGMREVEGMLSPSSDG
jgi:hypothetical protein